MTHPPAPEMTRDQAEALLHDVTAHALDLAFGSHDKTVTSGDIGQISSYLPETLPRNGAGPDALARLMTGPMTKHIRDYRHPLHFGHQRPAPLVASWAGDILAGATNSTVSAHEAGPMSVAIEERVNLWIKTLFDLPATARVTQTNGGSESILTGLLCAREHWQAAHPHPSADLRRAVILHSECAHYSIARSARVIGLSSGNIRAVPTHPNGRISITALDSAIETALAEGREIIAIVASAGTTANGAFDNLPACAKRAKQCGAWFHVDASHGGAAILSPNLTSLLDGIAEADSFGWNPHKLMWISPPSALFIARDSAMLWNALSGELAQASYIADQKALQRISPKDPVEWSLACTRPFSAIKVLASLFAYGSDALGARVARMVALAQHLAALVAGRSEFELLCQPDFNIVCFRLSAPDPDNRGHRTLRDRMATMDKAYLTGVEMHGRYWLRAHMISENTTKADLERLLDAVLEIGLSGQFPSNQPIPEKGFHDANRGGTRQ